LAENQAKWTAFGKLQNDLSQLAHH